MKLSAISGERTLDVIANIIEPIANIAQDKEANRLFVREKAPEGMSAGEFVIKKVKESLPKLIKNHKADIITIFSEINGVDREEYIKKLTMVSLVNDFVELLSDEAFTAFFTSSATQSEEKPSGNTSGNTSGRKA